MPHPHADLVARFYAAFAERDAATMARCYHAEVHFSDPVFPDLRGADAGAMWAMLCARGKDLRVSASAITANDATGAARWEARYTFSGSGRAVHNVIEASFRFRDGLIVRHEDRFDLWRWSRQAFGLTGLLLGWSPLVRDKVRAQAALALAHWRQGAQRDAVRQGRPVAT